jgi:Ca2+-binding RTX toxin-like protein
MSRRKFNSLRKFEKLEDRRMMAADIDLDNGLLTVQGTDYGDYITIMTDPDDDDQVIVGVQNPLTGDYLAQEDYELDDIDEVVVNALDGNDHIFNGTDIRARIYAGNGNDILESSAGNDYLDAGAGYDQLVGGQGDDELIGGSDGDLYYFWATEQGSDVVYESPSQDVDALNFNWLNGPINLDLASTAEQVVSSNHLRLRLSSGSGIEDVTGSDFDDVILGNSRDNLLSGMNGNDILYGALGNDTLRGGDGVDSLFGQAGNDNLAGGAGDDHVWGGENDDAIFGDDGNDYLYGENGRDTLNGGAGDDSLDGGFDAFKDALTGGSGADRFVQHRKHLQRSLLDQMLDFINGVDAVFTVWH